MNIVPLIGGAVFAAVGAYIIYDYQRFNKNATKAKGRILRYDEYFSKATTKNYTEYWIVVSGIPNKRQNLSSYPSNKNQSEKYPMNAISSLKYKVAFDLYIYIGWLGKILW